MYIAMALYGSGSPWPIGIFESEERAKSEAYRIGHPTSLYIIPAELNVNLELEHRPELKERIEQKEAYFTNLDDEGHLVRQGKDRSKIHISYDGIKTACGKQIGKGWERDKTFQHLQETCILCYMNNH